MLDRLQGVINLLDPPMAFRFGVFFFARGIIPNPIDIRFQKVSGLSATIESSNLNDGGDNSMSAAWFPEKVVHENVRLERGLTLLSPLNNEFDKALTDLKVKPSNVLIILFGDSNLPFSAWLLRKAYPVKWSISDLDADSSQLVIETMEISYQEFKPFRI